MACLSRWHQELTDGVGKCSVPMWSAGVPAGFCDKDAYGMQTDQGQSRFSGYVPALCCPGHGGPDREDAVAKPREIVNKEDSDDL